MTRSSGPSRGRRGDDRARTDRRRRPEARPRTAPGAHARNNLVLAVARTLSEDDGLVFPLRIEGGEIVRLGIGGARKRGGFDFTRLRAGKRNKRAEDGLVGRAALL